MGTTYNIAVVADILPKLFRLGVNLPIAQSRFYKEMKQVKENNKINPQGIFTPYTILENNTAFGVSEGGPILGGGSPEHVLGQAGLRAHWASMSWTGQLERIKTQYLNDIRRDKRFEGMSMDKLERFALNKAVEDQVASTLKMFARRDNYWALQGNDISSIGVVTALPGGTTVHYNWDDTPMGNRLFDKNQMIDHYSPGGVKRTSSLTNGYSVVTDMVDKTPDSGVDGPVVYDDVPSNLAVGDTAHFRNAHAQMPHGFTHYVDDTGDFNGIPRSDDPAGLSSVVIRLSGSPIIGPAHLRELDSLMESKMGYGIPNVKSYWMNKTQKYNWQSQLYTTPFTRQIGAGQVGKVDVSPGDKWEWDGNEFNIDVDVPPADFDSINFMSWERIMQTPLQPYQYNSGDYIVNPLNSSGEYLDSRQSTVFSEYDWVCWDARPNGLMTGFAFSRKHI